MVTRGSFVACFPLSQVAVGRGGGLQLWEAGMARLGRVVPCTFNTAVLLLFFSFDLNFMP
jgi:hypothetical protein